MLSLIRAHTPRCTHKSDRSWTRCQCPISYDGYVGGKRVRASLKTRDWERAKRRLREIEEKLENPAAAPTSTTIVEAAALYLASKSDLTPASQCIARRTVECLKSIAATSSITTLDQITLPFITHYRLARPISARTWVKELSQLKLFLRFTKSRYKLPDFEISDLKPPKVKATAKEPYTDDEIRRILAACDKLGGANYERMRARAIILLLQHTAMRIGHIVRLRRDRLRGNELWTRTQKNDVPLWLPLPPDLVALLNSLPNPRNSGVSDNSPYFFWSGNGSAGTIDRNTNRMLLRVFMLAGVEGAHAHRFRHTMATRLLERGYSFEDVALVLGSTPDIIRKHYAQWSTGMQSRVTEMLVENWSSTPDEGAKLLRIK